MKTLRQKCLEFDFKLWTLQRDAKDLFDEIPDTEKNKRLLETLEELINFDFEDSIPEEK